jgi:putative membrane-bound dehydrogenase-like protein
MASLPRLATVGLFLLGICSFGSGDDAPFEPPTGKPLTPREEQLTFRLPKGLVIELVASEPDVVDPVAMAFDEKGRLFVAEMRGYPNGGVGTGEITSGRVKVLEDLDGDGFFEKSAVYADGLRFPTSVMPYRDGVLVANAPDLVYLEEKDGKAVKSRVLYTGFDIANIQQLLSGFQWSLDNWVHGCAGGKGGTIKCPEKPAAAEVTLRGRGIRFKPDVPGSLEPTSGGGQYGLATDGWDHWFVATNSQHLRHIILPDHYLARNPNLPVTAVTLDVPDHGAACKVHRISPFESWRVERTKRRKGGPDSKRFPATELIPGGFVTSGTSPLIYAAALFPEEYHGNSFVCDPANNLVHRDILEARGGATYVARRADEDAEFLASTDNWFRPVWLTLGPDGAIYVADFYREIIETPLSLPEDMKQKLNLQSAGRGRIWRIRPEGKYQAPRFDLAKASSAELVPHLEHDNYWWRITAQRLLVTRKDRSIAPQVRRFLATTKSPAGRAAALWVLHGTGTIETPDLFQSLRDSSPLVREQALRLAEKHADDAKVRDAVAKLADDPSPKVRFQLAFTLGTFGETTALSALGRSDIGDPWVQTAVLTSARKTAPELLFSIVQDEETIKGAGSRMQFLSRLAALAANTPSDTDLARAFKALGKVDRVAPWQLAVLDGLGQGLRNSGRSLEKLWVQPSPELQAVVDQTRPLFTQAAKTAADDKQKPADRLAALRLLGYGPFESAQAAIVQLLTPQQPQEIQLAAVRALSQHNQAAVAPLLLKGWGSFGPTVRREVSEALLARPERVQALLEAIAQNKVMAGHLEPARLDQLQKYPDAAVRKQAARLLAGQRATARQEIIDDYKSALDVKGESSRGKLVFKKNCATCHRLENEGVEVGADLQSVLANKTPERLLVDILDPSREVDPRYIDYVVVLKSGRVATGLIAAETAASVTLRRAEKAEETILRSQIESITATARSLMPEGLERQLSRRDVADLIAYLQAVAAKKMTPTP